MDSSSPLSAIIALRVPPPRIISAMLHTQDDLDRARRHVEDGDRRIAEQRQRIAKLKMLGRPTEQSEIFLRQMLEIADLMRWHLREIAKDFEPRH